MERKKTIKIIVAIVLICTAMGVLGGIFGPQIMYHIKNRGALGPLTREDIEYQVVPALAVYLSVHSGHHGCQRQEYDHHRLS